MEWINLIGNIAGSASAGGIFGLIGSFSGAILKMFQTRQQQKFEKEKWKYEKELFELETERNRMEEDHELKILSSQGSWSGLSESIKDEASLSKIPTYKWATAVKQLYRPILTTMLCVISFLIFKDLLALFNDPDASVLTDILSPSEIKELLKYVVYSLVFATTTSIVWWFGDRAFAPPGLKDR